MKDQIHKSGPPRRTMRVLRWFCDPVFLEEIEGDLHELYFDEVDRLGYKRARNRFYFTALRYIRPYFFGKKHFSLRLQQNLAMIRHYLKVSMRHLVRQKFYSIINILGLAIGLACCIAVLVFVRDQTSYDTYHENEDRLYRVSIRGVVLSDQSEQLSALSPILWGPALQKDLPEVESFTRIVRETSPSEPWELAYGEKIFMEDNVILTDAGSFDIFGWNFQQGDPGTAFDEPFSMVMSSSMAQKYFGTSDAVGKTIQLDPRLRDNDGQLSGEKFEFSVTGVMEDIPRRSHFQVDILLPSVLLNRIYGGDINTGSGLSDWFWRGPIAHTYVQLTEGADAAVLEDKLDDFQERYVGEATRSRGYYYDPFLQRIDKIYLEGNMNGQLEPVADMTYIYMLSVIALFILIIACINFTNLSTARAAIRAREVGLRKVVGARRKQLIAQFLGESLLIAMFAFIVGLGLARLALPVLYDYLGKEMVFNPANEIPFLLGLAGVGILVGILAGGYPAFVLSRFRPIQVLQGFLARGAGGGLLRRGLVVFQFIISAFLIIATITVYRQLQFMRNHDLGFDQDQIMVSGPDITRPLASQYPVLKEELLSNPNVVDVTMSSALPGRTAGGDLYAAKGAAPETAFGLGEAFVDYNFVDMFGLEILSGRDFSLDRGGDVAVREENGRIREVSVILNEEAVRQFGWDNPEEALGKQIIRDPNAVDWTGTVIGVVRDFHVSSLREPIPAVSLILLPSYNYLAVKMAPVNLQTSIEQVASVVTKMNPEGEFSYTFLDEAFLEQYQEEQRLGEVFTYISFLAIFIACLGLFGLAAFMTNQRRREISIRKTLGASTTGIVFLLSREFTRLVLIAIVLAIPLAYLATTDWLEDFAYRIRLGVGIFLIASLIAIAIAFLTVSYQTIKAALVNPADNLRHE